MVDSFDMGGAETQTILLTRLLLQQGRYGVYLACLRREGILVPQVEELGLPDVPEFRLTSFYDANMAVQLRRFISFLRNNQIDVVHPQSFYTNVFAITGAALARVPARIAFRGDTGGWRSESQEFVERWSYRLAHVIHANSEAVKRFLINEGVPAQKIVTVYNGLDMGRVSLPSSVARSEVLDHFGLPHDRLFVTLVANMRHEIKNHRMFMRMAARVHKANPNVAFILAGEGELTAELRAYASELGLADSTFFVGRCDDVARLLFISHICVLTSRAEGFSNSILEYMAAERPVVATNVGGASEAIEEGITGYLVASDDDKTMAERINFLVQDLPRAQEMGRRGRERVNQLFSDQAQLKNTTALYDSLLAQRNKALAATLRPTGTELG
jgi:glycosyltransferase involved in cell wall biosynthesis